MSGPLVEISVPNTLIIHRLVMLWVAGVWERRRVST